MPTQRRSHHRSANPELDKSDPKETYREGGLHQPLREGGQRRTALQLQRAHCFRQSQRPGRHRLRQGQRSQRSHSQGDRVGEEADGQRGRPRKHHSARSSRRIRWRTGAAQAGVAGHRCDCGRRGAGGDRGCGHPGYSREIPRFQQSGRTSSKRLCMPLQFFGRRTKFSRFAASR